MKTTRHNKILELINKFQITTQEELIEHLRAEGYDVTQSTVSRDIKQLRLTKTLMPDGKYRYQASPSSEKGAKNNFHTIFSSSVISIEIVRLLLLTIVYPLSDELPISASVRDGASAPQQPVCQIRQGQELLR